MSLRVRLFLTYAGLILLSLFLVSALLTVTLQRYRDRLTMDRLDELARPIANQLRNLNQTSATRQGLLVLETAARNNDLYVLLGNNKGNLVAEVSPEGLQQPPTLPLATGELPHNIGKALQGSFVTGNGVTMIYAAYPVKNASLTELPGLDTFILAAPRLGPLAVWATLVRPIAVAGIIALAISLLIAFLLARSVYKPIARVTQATKSVARGNYDEKLPVAGPQEIQDLASGFNYMADEVKKSQQQLRYFVADISHQLKSPLTSIQGFAQAILDGTVSDEQGKLKAANIILDESKRMRRQVDELLELARMQSGQLKMQKKPVDLNDLLTHCCEIYEIQAKEKQITLTCTAEPGLATTGDADWLEQIFNNLLDNAIKNLPERGAVKLTGRRDGDKVEIHVTDDGPGIPQDQIPHVFERFYQVTGMRTGVGLGLAIAREIVLVHGGTIEVKSEPGLGADFVVMLPGLVTTLSP